MTNKVYLTKDEFLKEFDFKNPFAYNLFQHFIQLDIEENEIEDWVWNPFDYEDPHLLLSFPDIDKDMAINGEDDTLQSDKLFNAAIRFKEVNKVYGRDFKINEVIS